MKTLVLCNQKGGVGKSAVATLLVHQLAHRGRRVLAIDLDHQGNFSKPLRLSGRVGRQCLCVRCPADRQRRRHLPDQPFVLVPGDRGAAWPGTPARAAHALRPATSAPSSPL